MVSGCCQVYYNSQIELPKDFSGRYESAIAYTKNHLKEVPLRELEYILGFDVLDEKIVLLVIRKNSPFWGVFILLMMLLKLRYNTIRKLNMFLSVMMY